MAVFELEHKALLDALKDARSAQAQAEQVTRDLGVRQYLEATRQQEQTALSWRQYPGKDGPRL